MRIRRHATWATVGLASVALSAAALGPSAAGGQLDRDKLGAIVAQDSARDNPAAAVAQVTLQRGEIGRVSYRITTVPNRTKVDWGITTRCMRGPTIDYFPLPGQFRTKTEPAGFGGRFPVPLADPDFCTFAVAGQTFKNEAGKRVTVKIYNKR